MGRSSQRKGAAGERELAGILNANGYDTRRGIIPYGGEPDIVGLPAVHVECKRVEKLSIYTAYEQASRDANGKIPAVFHRRNHKPWLVVMALTDWLQFYRKWRE